MSPIHGEGEWVSLSVGLGVHSGEGVRIRITTGRGGFGPGWGSELTYFESSTQKQWEGFCYTEDSK